ncbi:MAG: hypothetical protein KJS92_05565 [Bacteroidetes bacterium]|nr:hypothetical protein [Bacteroidota bacterium]
MNKDYLNQLLDNPGLISETDVYSLEQLCRQFPYFSVPFLLLAHARKQKNDYRAADTLHAAALRTSQRPWLRTFIEPETTLRQSQPEEPILPEKELSREPETISSLQEDVPVLAEQEQTLNVEATVPQPISMEPVQTEKTETPVVERLNIHESLPAYSIEQYFPETRDESVETDAPKDFYTWLKQPRHKATPPPVSMVKEKKKDTLIENFLKTNPSISRPKKEFFNPLNVAKKSEQMDDTLVTETLAHIYWKQGNLKAALQAFERLILKFPEKRPYFAGLIQKISNELKQS